MKRFILLFSWLPVMATLLTACGGVPETMLYQNQYRLHVNFRDVAGNDLVAPLGEEYYISEGWRTKWVNEINPEKYSLDIILPDGLSSTKPYYSLAKYNDYHSWLTPGEDGKYDGDGIWYLESNYVPTVITSNAAIQSPLTYRLSCPTIFGDGSIHEIVAWWDEGTLISGNCRILTCIKVVFDGKEIQPILGTSYNENAEPCYFGYFIDIVLDK